MNSSVQSVVSYACRGLQTASARAWVRTSVTVTGCVTDTSGLKYSHCSAPWRACEVRTVSAPSQSRLQHPWMAVVELGS
jgi:hypothetical protein